MVSVHTLAAGNRSFLHQETIDIPVAQYRTVNFALPPHLSDSASLYGTVSIIPDTASIELILLHIDDYFRWRENAGNVDTLWYTQLSSGSFEMGIPGLGSYSLVVSNRGNYHPVSLSMDLSISYAGRGGTGDPLPAALRLALLLLMVGACAVATGSVLSKYFYRRRNSLDGR